MKLMCRRNPEEDIRKFLEITKRLSGKQLIDYLKQTHHLSYEYLTTYIGSWRALWAISFPDSEMREYQLRIPFPEWHNGEYDWADEEIDEYLKPKLDAFRTEIERALSSPNRKPVTISIFNRYNVDEIPPKSLNRPVVRVLPRSISSQPTEIPTEKKVVTESVMEALVEKAVSKFRSKSTAEMVKEEIEA